MNLLSIDVYYVLTVLFRERSLLWFAKNVEHQFRRPAQLNARSGNYERTVDQDGMGQQGFQQLVEVYCQ